MKESSANVTYVHQDHLSGTSLMSDGNGNQVGTTMLYAPFGSTMSGSVPTDRKFTGQRLDDTGLYYYGARYYDATIGRFISPDPFVQWSTGFDVVFSPLTVNTISEGLGELLGPQRDYPAVSLEVPVNPQALNRYSYVLNNPLKYTDPFGWWTFGLGINLQFTFMGASFSASIMIVTSGRGQLGIVWAGGGGGGAGYRPMASGLGTGIGGGITAQVQYIPNADSIEELRGPSVQIGGSGGAKLYGGAEYVVAETYQGVNVQIGYGAGFEMHGILETAGVWVSPLQMPWGEKNDASNLLPLEIHAGDTGGWYGWYDWYEYDWYGW